MGKLDETMGKNAEKELDENLEEIDSESKGEKQSKAEKSGMGLNERLNAVGYVPDDKIFEEIPEEDEKGNITDKGWETILKQRLRQLENTGEKESELFNKTLGDIEYYREVDERKENLQQESVSQRISEDLGAQASEELDDTLNSINSEFGEGVKNEDEVIDLDSSAISVEKVDDGEIIDVDASDISVEGGNAETDQEAEEAAFAGRNEQGDEDDPDQEAEEIISRQRESEKVGDDPEETDEELIVGQREEAVEKEMEKSYQSLLNIQGQFVKAQEGKKKLNKLRALLGGKKSKEATEVAKDFDNIKEEYENSKEDFRNKFGAFGSNLVNGKRFELENEGENGKELKYKLLQFMHTEKVIDSGGKDKKGEAIMRSISEEYNKRLFDLDSAKIEKLPSKTKQICKKALERYQKLPKAAKIALGTSAAVLIGAATGAVGTVGAAAVYGGQRAARSYLGGLFGAAASGGASTAYETVQGAKNVKKGKTEKDFRQKAKEDLAEQVKVAVESGDENQEVEDAVKEGLLKGVEKQKKMLDEMNEYHRKQLRNRMIAAGMVGVAVGGGVAAIANGMVDTDSIFGTKPKAQIGQSTGIGSGDGGQGIETKVEPLQGSDTEGGAPDGEDVEKRPPIEEVKTIPADEGNSQEKEADVGEQETAVKDQEPEPEKKTKGSAVEELKVVPGEPIELEKGDSVWGTLKERNLSDRDIMNKVNSFSRQLGEKLVADGVDPQRAKEFISWRFGHMDVGEQFAVDESGNLVVEDFLSKNKLDQFGISSKEELGVIDTSDTHPEESLSTGLDGDDGEPTDQVIEKDPGDEVESTDQVAEEGSVGGEETISNEEVVETVNPRAEISSLSSAEKELLIGKLGDRGVDSKVFNQISGSSAEKVLDGAAERLRELSKATMNSGQASDSLDVQRTMGLLRHMKQTVDPFENETFAQYLDRYSQARSFSMDDKDLERLSNIYIQAHLAETGEGLNVDVADASGDEGAIEKEVENKTVDEEKPDSGVEEIPDKFSDLKTFDSFRDFVEERTGNFDSHSHTLPGLWEQYKEVAPDEIKTDRSFESFDKRFAMFDDSASVGNKKKALDLISRFLDNKNMNYEMRIHGAELAEKMGIEFDQFANRIDGKFENGVLTEIEGHKVPPEFLTDKEVERVNNAREALGKELMEKEPVDGSEDVEKTSEGFQGEDINVDKETFEKVGQFSPKQVEDAVFAKDSEISSEGKDFLKRVIATNLNAKAGESFEEYLERYFENEDVPEVTQKERGVLGEIYKKMGE